MRISFYQGWTNIIDGITSGTFILFQIEWSLDTVFCGISLTILNFCIQIDW